MSMDAAARIASSRPDTGWPRTADASVSLTTSHSTPASSRSSAPRGTGARFSRQISGRAAFAFAFVAGAGRVPAAWVRAWFRAARMAGTGTSAEITSTSGWAARAAATSSSPTAWLAPLATVIMFSPEPSMVIRARPEATPATSRTASVSTDSACRACRSCRPRSSGPRQPAIRTSAPSRAAATAWLPPLPPGANRAAVPSTVAPGPGSSGTVTEMSMFMLPSTVSRGFAGMPAPARRSGAARRRAGSGRLRGGVAGPGRPPGDQHGQDRGDRAGEHRGPVAGGPGPVPDTHRHRRQQRGPDGRADLTAGVDHPTDHALVAVGNAAAGDHDRAEGGAGGAEPDQHHGQQQRAVAVGRQLGQDQEAGGDEGPGHGEQPADPAETGRQPGGGDAPGGG